MCMEALKTQDRKFLDSFAIVPKWSTHELSFEQFSLLQLQRKKLEILKMGVDLVQMIQFKVDLIT